MKYLLILFTIILVQCCTGNKSRQTAALNEDSSAGIIIKDTTNSTPVTKVKGNVNDNNDNSGKDTLQEKKPSGQGRPGSIDLENGRFLISNPPSCLRSYVKKIMNDEVKNPPQKIYSYQYNGRTVYYVTAPCCDFFSDLLNSDCKLIGHPDGGITGKGDGKITDFHSKRSGEKLVWEDPRLPR